MATKPYFQLSAFLLLIIFVTGCVPNSGTTSSLTTQSTGVVIGRLIDPESQKPHAGALIILGRISVEGECNIKANLVSSTDDHGKFSLSGVPSGAYVLFYDLSGKARATLKSIDGLRIIYRLGRHRSFGSVMTEEFFATFGGGGAVFCRSETTAKIKDGKIISLDGSFSSEKYGLTIDFHKGKPIIVEVKPGETTELEIKALQCFAKIPVQ